MRGDVIVGLNIYLDVIVGLNIFGCHCGTKYIWMSLWNVF